MSLLRQLASSNYISVNKTLIKLFGLEEAVLLGELCAEYDHWETEGRLIDGTLFYCTVDKMQDNTGLTDYQQRKAIKSLENAGILKTYLKGVPATRYFEIDEVQFFSFLRTSSEKTKELVLKKLNSSNNININNKLFNNKLLNNSENPKKPNLYDKCFNLIIDFTEDEILRNMLVDFLKKCLENSRESGIAFYTNTFKGKLNALKRLSEDNYRQREIVKQTLDNGWNGFYELKENKKGKSVVKDIENLPENHPKVDKKKLKEDIANGNVTYF